MAKVLYRTVLTDAWNTTWRNKSFWLWGLFVGLLGNAGEYQLLLTAVDRVASRDVPDVSFGSGLVNIPVQSTVIKGLWDAILTQPFSTFMLLVVAIIAIALVVFFIWLAMVSVVALINGTSHIAAKKKAPTMGDGVEVGNQFFGPVLITYVFGRLIMWLLLSFLALLGALSVLDYYIGFPFFLVGFVVIVPTLFVVSFLIRYAIMYVVVRKQPVLEAVESALNLFRRHWLITLELGFMLFVVNIVLGLIMVVLMGLFVAPPVLAAIIAWQTGLGTAAVILASLSIVIFLVILFTLGSMLGTFQWAAWTHLFIALKERGHSSKIVRVFSKFFANRPIWLPGA